MSAKYIEYKYQKQVLQAQINGAVKVVDGNYEGIFKY